jgi:hypothetical protein
MLHNLNLRQKFEIFFYCIWNLAPYQEEYLREISSESDDVIPEMKFLDINLTKDSSLLLHAIHSSSTGGFERKPYSTPVLKIHTKKSA